MQIDESYWSTSNSGCLHGLPCFFLLLLLFAVLLAFATANHKRRIQLLARQFVALVVIRVANLKFVAESRTRVYFAQHVAITSTCNIVFCYETTVGHKRGNTRNRARVSTYNATMKKEKKKNVARITGP